MKEGRRSYLFLVDARRGDARLLKKTLSSIPRGATIWAMSEEPLVESKRVSRWISNEQLSFLAIDVKRENEDRAVVAMKAGETDFPTNGDLESSRYREVDITNSNIWRGWAYWPVRRLSRRSVESVRAAIQGQVEAERESEVRLLAVSTLAKKRILFVGSSDIHASIGGISHHVRDMIRHFTKDHLVFYLCPDRLGYLIRAYDSDGDTDVVQEFDWGNRDQLSNPSAEKAFREFISTARPDTIHFHHLGGLPFSLVKIAKETTRTVVSLHDYYAFCTRHDLINARGEFCGFCKSESSCTKIEADETYSNGSLSLSAAGRRKKIRSILDGVTKIVPSKSARDHFVEHMGLRASEILVRETPIAEQQRSAKLAQATRERITGEVTVAFIGAFSHKSGASLFAKLVRSFAESKPRVKWNVFGELLEPDLVLSLEEDFGVQFFGGYSREDLPSLIHREKVDLGLILPIWPETHAMTVSETIAAGCVPVVTDIGAPRDLVESLGFGHVIRRSHLERDFEKILKRFESDARSGVRVMPPAPTKSFESSMHALVLSVTNHAILQ